MVRYPAGFVNPSHTHPCGHGLYVLEGTLVTHKGMFPPGTFVWFPEGEVMEHGATEEGDVTALFTIRSISALITSIAALSMTSINEETVSCWSSPKGRLSRGECDEIMDLRPRAGLADIPPARGDGGDQVTHLGMFRLDVDWQVLLRAVRLAL